MCFRGTTATEQLTWEKKPLYSECFIKARMGNYELEAEVC